MIRVLIADDHVLVREGLRHVLQQDAGFEVAGEAVDSARSLIKTVATTPPGNTVRVTVRRQGREIEIPVAVGRRPKIEEN